MVNTEKETALMLAQCLAAYGVSDIFSSPGSRNAPLIMALARHPGLTVRPVVDERSAAFIALGFASVSQRPAALVCTSGTALLNYAPAIAEAFYRKVPLIVISADRPAEWIEQDDSQTIRQPGALANFVKESCRLKGEITGDRDRWFVNRTLNGILQAALTRRPGPVHINISFTEPLTATTSRPTDGLFRKIDLMLPPNKLDPEDAKRLALEAADSNLLIVGGFCPPSAGMSIALARLSKLPGVVVVADALANVNARRDDILSRPDLFIESELLRRPGAKPSMLITFGGSVLSKKLKDYLRSTPLREHWHIGDNSMLIDSYFSLTRRIEINESDFFPRFANAMDHIRHGKDSLESQKSTAFVAGQSEFKALWHEAAFLADAETNKSETDASWSARQAILTILRQLPAEWNLQLSNGLTPRLAMLGDATRFHRRDCNRGASGIDGSVSTALGASVAYNGTTLLLTGDMSMQYDIAALSSTLLSPKLKIIVINNHGGGIFREIATTRNLPERDSHFVCHLNLPLDKIADTYGLAYFLADSTASLQATLPPFATVADRPALMEIRI